jgi:hypothetical protein
VEVLPGFGHMLHHAAADRIIAAVEELIGRAWREVKQTRGTVH